MPMFRHGFFQIAILNSGDGELQRDKQVESFNDFTLFMTVPGQLLSWDIQRNWQGFYASFTDDYITIKHQNRNFLRHFPFLRRSIPASLKLSASEAKSIIELFEKLHLEHLKPSPYSKSIIESYLNILLEYTRQFFDQYGSSKEAKSNSPLTERFDLVLEEMIRAHALGQRERFKSVGEIAEELAVTPKHLSETLKNETGQTALAHIHHSLIQLAQSLLSTTDLTVTEISFQLGFENPNYFMRLFKKKTDMTPRAYRNSVSAN